MLFSDPLDTVLFRWPSKDAYTTRDLLRSIAIFGQTGSGKTSGSGLKFARAAVGLKRSGGLILASKPEDRAFWVKRFKEAGRKRDLIVFAPGQPARCNFLDYELKCGGDSRSLTQFLMITGEALGEGRGENEKFWEMSKQRILYNSIEPCRMAYGNITIPNIQEFISTAAYNAAQLDNKKPEGGESPLERFEKMFHCQTMMAAFKKKKTAIEQHDFTLCHDYWTKEFLNMDNKVRSSILADTMNILHTYNTGIVREMVSTTSTITPAIMGKGKWVLCDFPLDVYGASGKIIMAGWKLLVQKYILRRHVKRGDSVIVIHADEFQEHVSSFDNAFLAKSRSHLGCMIALTQSIHSCLGKMKEADAKALLTNFFIKVFHSIGDGETAQYASSLLGKRRESFVSFQPKQETSLGEEIFGLGGGTGNISESYQEILQPAVFMSGLRCGGRQNKYTVDGIVIKSGEPFLSGENWQFCSFSQR